MGRTRIVVAVMLVALSCALVRGAAAASACSAPASQRGEWPSYGHDLSNTRDQTAVKHLGLTDAAGLQDGWAASDAAMKITGSFESVPVVANGCVFAGTDAGTVVALDASTGKLVWKTKLGGSLLIGGVFAPAVSHGRVFGLVSGKGPYAVALDEHTGRLLWQSKVVTKGSGYYTNASAVVYRDIVLEGFSGPEGDHTARGGYALIDTRNGRILRVVHPVPDAEFKKGYGGPGIWSTAAVDARTGYAYVGAGNPDGAREYRYTNSILKIDLDRDRASFGHIVDAYKGTIDQYDPAARTLASTPVCTALPDGGADRPWCGQLDLDFGASPTLFRDRQGQLVVADLQKAGVLHAVYGNDMQQDWTTLVGTPCALCNAASPANDGHSIYAVGTPGGQMVAVDELDGAYRWAAPVADGVHYEAVSVAGQVVFTVDTHGNLDVFDTQTGLEVQRPLALDDGDVCVPIGGGVSIAEGKVFVACDTGFRGGSWIVAFRLP
jgi:polyvinyl alcohol dehydrogenase (cytochrome)